MNRKTLSIVNSKVTKKDILLPGGESNPGLPRDRRGYLPLYYRGVMFTELKCGLVDIGLPIVYEM